MKLESLLKKCNKVGFAYFMNYCSYRILNIEKEFGKKVKFFFVPYSIGIFLGI